MIAFTRSLQRSAVSLATSQCSVKAAVHLPQRWTWRGTSDHLELGALAATSETHQRSCAERTRCTAASKC